MSLLGNGDGSARIVTSLGTIDGHVDGIEALLAAATPAGENHTGEVGFNINSVGVERTRPADTTAYTAKDVVADATSGATNLVFTDIGRVNGGTGFLVKARLMTDQKTCTARFRLHLFHTAPTAIADNEPYTLLYSNAANRIGQIDFPALSTEDATNSTAAASLNDLVRLAFKLAPGSRAIYGMLETLDAFTPASGQKFYVELTVANN